MHSPHLCKAAWLKQIIGMETAGVTQLFATFSASMALHGRIIAQSGWIGKEVDWQCVRILHVCISQKAPVRQYSRDKSTEIRLNVTIGPTYGHLAYILSLRYFEVYVRSNRFANGEIHIIPITRRQVTWLTR